MPLEVGQKVNLAWPLIEAKVIEVKEIVGPNEPRTVKLAAVFDFSFGPEAGPMPRVPAVVSAAQDREVPATSRMKQ